MNWVVQKYGGTSVADPARIGRVADRVAARFRGGEGLVVVVSAMAGETNRLLALASEVAPQPDPRETDALVSTGEQVSAALLALALKVRGVPSRSLTAAQMRMQTYGAFSRARIKAVDHRLIRECLARGEVVVATGFQGIDDGGNVTTLGRGGSDTTAVAIAAALQASECEIYTDVDGVYTADPSVCPKARRLDRIGFEEMLELASLGAKVLQIRSVELAMNHGIPVRVRSSFSDHEGTLVTHADELLERVVVRGISHDTGEAKLTLRHVPDRPGVAAKIFSALAEAEIDVDVIVQNTSESGTTDVSFTVARADTVQAERIVREVGRSIAARAIELDDSVAKVSIVGAGMRSHPGVAAKMFATLAAAGINIQMITTGEIKVTCVIERSRAGEAVRLLHDAFGLETASSAGALAPARRRRRPSATRRVQSGRRK